VIVAAAIETLDPGDGAVNITYEGAVGGETGTIDAPSDPAVTFNNSDLPVEQSTVIADAEGYADLVFSSVDPAEGPITATVTGSPGATNCEIDQSPGTMYPIVAKSVTIVYAQCTPVP